MSALVEEQFARGDVRHVVMVEIDHPAGTGRFFLGTGVIDYGGNSYYGWGAIGSVSEVVSSTEIEIVETSITFSGVDPDLLDGLDDSVKGRLAQFYDAFLDRDMQVIERELLHECACDYQVHAVAGDGKATISIKAHGGLFFLRKRSAAKCSPEEARAQFPDETGFDRIHLQEDLVPVWRTA